MWESSGDWEDWEGLGMTGEDWEGVGRSGYTTILLPLLRGADEWDQWEEREELG